MSDTLQEALPSRARGEREPVVVAAHPSLGQQSSSGAGVPVLPVGPMGVRQRLSLPLQRRHGRFHSQRLLGPLPRPSSPDAGATESDAASLDPQEPSFPVGCFEPQGTSYCRQPASCLHLAQLPDPTGFSCLSCLLFSIVSVSFSELHSTLLQNRPDPRCSEQEIFLPGSGRPDILLETANDVGRTSGQVPEGYQPPPHGGARPHRKGLGLCGYMGSIPWASWKAEQA